MLPITIGVIVLIVIIILVSYAVNIYNGLIEVSNNIIKAWANIDVLLKQRHDEIPKLIKVCETYMQYERETLDRVLKAREALVSAGESPEKLGQAENGFKGALRKLFALAENYPDLKAQSSFQQVQGRISGLESEIADRREFYNDSVNNFNIRIASFPDIYFARKMGFEPKEMYQVSEEEKKDTGVEIRIPKS